MMINRLSYPLMRRCICPTVHVSALQMTDHAILDDGLHQTIYADGTRVVVNYGSSPQLVDGDTVEALGYLILRPDPKEPAK